MWCECAAGGFGVCGGELNVVCVCSRWIWCVWGGIKCGVSVQQVALVCVEGIKCGASVQQMALVCVFGGGIECGVSVQQVALVCVWGGGN